MTNNNFTAKLNIYNLWCQHCKALQKVTGVNVDCWWNPLDEDYKHAFCAANIDAVDHLIPIIEERVKGEVREWLDSYWAGRGMNKNIYEIPVNEDEQALKSKEEG